MRIFKDFCFLTGFEQAKSDVYQEATVEIDKISNACTILNNVNDYFKEQIIEQKDNSMPKDSQ